MKTTQERRSYVIQTPMSNEGVILVPRSTKHHILGRIIREGNENAGKRIEASAQRCRNSQGRLPSRKGGGNVEFLGSDTKEKKRLTKWGTNDNRLEGATIQKLRRKRNKTPTRNQARENNAVKIRTRTAYIRSADWTCKERRHPQSGQRALE